MEDFGKVINKRIQLFMCITILGIVASIFDAFVVGNSANAGYVDGMVEGFSFGMIIVLGMLALVQVLRLSKIKNDEMKLKMLYNKEHDERLKSIRSKAGMPMIMITSTLMFVAGIIGGYFEETIFYALVTAGVVQLFISAIVKMYCLKTI